MLEAAEISTFLAACAAPLAAVSQLDFLLISFQVKGRFCHGDKVVELKPREITAVDQTVRAAHAEWLS